MTYIIEIELPSSSIWFNYMTGIESREEAENIKREAEEKVKVRVRKERVEGCEINDKKLF
jgi:hypothetical protein